jgi:phosphoglycerate dehydrogenase-like enzyme
VTGLVVNVAFPARVPTRYLDQIRGVVGHGEVLAVPYEQPTELRHARGRRAPVPDAERPVLTAEQQDAFGRAEVILAFDVPFDLDVCAPNLRWIQAIGAGVDHFYGAQLSGAVTVTNAAGVSAAPIAEFVIGRLLSVWKRFDELQVLQRDHRWEPTYGRMLAGSTIVIIGLGAIGRQVARRARALGMHVVAVRRRPDRVEGRDEADEVVGLDGLHDALASADAVVVAAPASAQTRNLIDAKALAAMKIDAVLVNVARGMLVDEEALLTALDAGHLRAAILDVARHEPLPADSPLWDAPRLHLSPHSSTVPDHYLTAVVDLFADNLARYLAGAPLLNVVDPELYL